MPPLAGPAGNPRPCSPRGTLAKCLEQPEVAVILLASGGALRGDEVVLRDDVNDELTSGHVDAARIGCFELDAWD